MKLDIQDIWDNKIDEATLLKTIKCRGEIEIVFPLESIGSTQSYLDIINDYIMVSYCSEKIASFVKIKKGEITTINGYSADFTIICTPHDTKNLVKHLIYFSPFFSREDDELSDEDRISFYDEIEEYSLNFNKQYFVFPELANNYWANLINGAYWEIAEYYDSEDEFFKKTYRKYPEHKYGFWKNALSTKYDETIYFSTENWIIPPKSNIIQALKVYSGLETDLILEKAEIINYKGFYVIVNSSSAVWFKKSGVLFKSISCIEKTHFRNEKQLPTNPEEDLDDAQLSIFSEYPSQRKRKRINHNFNSIPLDSEKFQYHLSEFGDLVLVEYLGFSYVFFIQDNLNFEEMKELNEHLNPFHSKIQNLIGQSCLGKCNWDELDDDTFEELCYDIIYCHPKFDSTTIQKMGKSKSRDGGRDIVVKTKKTPTTESELFIIQCKFTNNSNSLSASKLPNAGNVIMQYGAKGYGVFTSTVIDSTLYDMLDGFKNKMGLDTSIRWSKYELERFFNMNQQLKNKYFRDEN